MKHRIQSAAVRDSLFLSVVVVLSFVLYVFQLGFYSDDWSVLGYASVSKDPSYLGIFDAIFGSEMQMRPVHFLYLAGLYKFFGMDPTGYHLVNGCVFLAGILLFYHVLRRFDQPRRYALAVPVVYALLPHYHSVLFWIVAFQVVLSMTAYFLSLYGDLRAAPAEGKRLWGWKSLSIAAMLVSVLAYEMFLPLFLLNPVIVWYHARRHNSAAPWPLGKHALFWAAHYVAFGAAVVYKLLVASRMPVDDDLVWHLKWFYHLIKDSFKISYVDYGFGYPARMLQVIERYFEWDVAALGIIVGTIIFTYLFFVSRRTGDQEPDRSTSILYIVIGIAVFFAGFSIFLTNYNAIATPTGIANRIAIAAAVGVALTYVGGAVWVSSWLRSPRVRAACFSFFVALLCMSGMIINNTVASFWIRAFEREQAILADLFDHFPDLPEGATVLLDGMCPYVGPAVVFESSWDLQGALMTHFGTSEIYADVITPETKIDEDGIHPVLYGNYTHYPFGENTFIYNVEQRSSYRLHDAAAARQYFRTYNPGQNDECPDGTAGVGVRIF